MTRPADGSIRRLIRRSKVDLPAPERPIIPTKLPVPNSRDTSDTADIWPNVRVTPFRTSIQRPPPASGGYMARGLVRQSCDSAPAAVARCEQLDDRSECHSHVMSGREVALPSRGATMASKILSATPLIHSTAEVRDSSLGAYTEV